MKKLVISRNTNHIAFTLGTRFLYVNTSFGRRMFAGPHDKLHAYREPYTGTWALMHDCEDSYTVRVKYTYLRRILEKEDTADITQESISADLSFWLKHSA